MLAHLADVSIRSLVLALLAVLALLLMRGRRTAALQHALWASVMCGMLALFTFGQVLPRLPLRILHSAGAPVAHPAAFPLRLADSPSATSRPAALQHRPTAAKDVALYAYGVIAFAFLAQFVTGMFLVRRLAASGRPISDARMNGVYESDRASIPLTVNWLRPRILLPLEWRRWDRDKLDAVLAHETAHVRRRDALFAALAGLNRSLFWFHPLAWMLERKLALLAEQACDETCIAELGDRERYARLLLDMAAVVDRSRGRLRRHALTMASGSHIRRRIDSILIDGRTFSRGLGGKTRTAVVLCGVPLVLIAGAIEIAFGPGVRITHAQTTPTPKFDQVSIKPCAEGDGAGRAGRGGSKGRGIPASPPGELFVNCMTVWELVGHSVTETAPLLNDFGGPFEAKRVTGGPAWIYAEYYTIDAKSNDPAANVPGPRGNANFKLLSGPMLVALLEDRFQLKFRRVIEQVPVYSLTVASSGFRLQPAQPGECIPHEPGTPVLTPGTLPAGQKPSCIQHGGWEGPNWTIDAASQGIGNLAAMLAGMASDRPVIDNTGISGLYTFHLAFAHDANAPGSLPPGMNPFAEPSNIERAPSLPDALEQQLGLHIAAENGPREVIVIDSVERPSTN